MNGVPSRTGFLGVLRGIWLFTWKSQLTWRRLPLHLLLLLGLPALVYLTTSIRAWTGGYGRGSGDPFAQYERFCRGLERADQEMDPDKDEKMQAIYVGELFQMSESQTENPRTPEAAQARTERLKACYERISKQAEAVLKKEQMVILENHIRRRVQESERMASQQQWSRAGAYYHWIIDFYFFVILPLACVNASGALIRDELQADTLGFLHTRPVSRARLLAAKYLAQTAWLQLFLLVESLLLIATGRLQHIQDIVSFLPLLLGAQFLAVFAWSALGVLLGQIAKRYIALALIYGLIVERGIGNIPTNINNLSLTSHLRTLLAHHPSLQTIYNWPGEGVWFAAGALVLAAAVFLGLAIALFTFLECHHTSEMQK
jgi:hypothetical protein